jgi:hypothetical protein
MRAEPQTEGKLICTGAPKRFLKLCQNLKYNFRMLFSSWVYADDVNMLGGRVHTIKENAEALVVASKEIGLEVNADKSKYMVMSRDQNAGRCHSMKLDNDSFERVTKLKYLGTTLTNQTSIQEEIKSRMKSANACYHSVLVCFPKI